MLKQVAPTVGIVCGYETEAKIARMISPLVGMSGTLEQNARRCAEELVAQGATALLSFGLAGGLSPDLPKGSFVIADRVTNDHEEWWRCDETILAHLRRLPNVIEGAVYGSRTAVSSPVYKRILFERTQCLIVDMESHIVAEVAAKYRLPFAVVRAVSDAYDEALPPAALVSVLPNGKISYGAVFKSVRKHPSQIRSLQRLGATTHTIMKEFKAKAPAIKQAFAMTSRSGYSAATVA